MMKMLYPMDNRETLKVYEQWCGQKHVQEGSFWPQQRGWVGISERLNAARPSATWNHPFRNY
jgi:hypothetical protein